MVPITTFSHSCCCVQFSPTTSGAATPLAFRVEQVVRNSGQVLGTVTPHAFILAGLYQKTLLRCTFTGTLQMPPLYVISLIRSAGNTLLQPSLLNSGVRSCMRLATTHVPISSCPPCAWKEAGGVPPSRRVLRTALAFVPAPTETVALS